MAKLVCENGDFLELDAFKRLSTGNEEDYIPDCTISVTIKAGTFFGVAEICSYATWLDSLCGELVEICRNYEGSASIESEDCCYWPSTITFTYSVRGYVKICGVLADDCPDGQKLNFSMSAPVGSFDSFLPELQAELALLKAPIRKRPRGRQK